MGLFVYFSRPYACHQRCCGLLGAQKDGALRGAVLGSSQAVLPAAAKLNHPRASRMTPERPSRSVQPVTVV